MRYKLEPWEEKLKKEIDCHHDKGKVHLYECNEALVDPFHFEENLWNHYDLVDSYMIWLPILEAMHRRDWGWIIMWIICHVHYLRLKVKMDKSNLFHTEISYGCDVTRYKNYEGIHRVGWRTVTAQRLSERKKIIKSQYCGIPTKQSWS